MHLADVSHLREAAAAAYIVPQDRLYPLIRETIMNRREFLDQSAAAAAAGALPAAAAAQQRERVPPPIAARDPLRITRLETFLVRPRWLFLKIHTNAGIVGLGEPIL